MMRKAMDRIVEGYIRLRVGLAGLVEDVRGLQTLEWVALAIVILALLGAVAAFLNNSGRAPWVGPWQMRSRASSSGSQREDSNP